MASDSRDEELDFNEAMDSFSRMFPDLQRSSIEAALRANRGSVDATVDQLLAVSLQQDTQSNTQSLNHNHKRDEQQKQSYVNVNKEKESKQWSGSGSACGPSMYHDPPPSYWSIHNSSKYKPPLVGHLPETDPWDNLDEIYEELHNPRSQCQPAHKPAPAQMHSPHNTYLGVMHLSSGHNKSHFHKGLEHPNTGTSGLSAQRRKRYNETAKQAELLHDRMIDNQFQRQLAQDPELERYLDDERVAIMMQNREFMKELRRNNDFMVGLSRDSRSRMSSLSTPSKSTTTKRSQRFSLDSKRSSAEDRGPPVPEGPSVRPTMDEKHMFSSTGSVDVGECTSELYGHDNEGSCLQQFAQPFPYTQTLPATSHDMSNTSTLHNMSKTSRQKFAMLARKFAGRTKGAKASLGTSGEEHWPERSLLDSAEHEHATDNVLQTDYGYDQNTDNNIQVAGTEQHRH